MSDINSDEWYVEFHVGTCVMLPHGQSIEEYIDQNFIELYEEAIKDGANDGIYISGIGGGAKGEWFY